MSAAVRRRVALVDLRVRENTFIGEGDDLPNLALELRAAGHEVVSARSVLESEPGGLAAWNAKLAQFARGGFDLVVLTKAWEASTVEAIRGALERGATLVRFSEGHAATLDDRFDFVLDPAGILVLANGGTPESGAVYRRTSARELREKQRGAPVLPVLAPEQPVDVATGAFDPGARATIHGPAAGCPFLLDATTNPVFARVKLDRDSIQTRGCSFCLDNSGAYAMPGEAEVLATWLAKLRALRRARPELREVLLTDERPHPFLPAFFRAIADEPGLGPIELLFKSRVDWLLEFEGEIAQAAGIAARSGSVLHLYLVGFESFDQFHLDLFNKGVTVADNVRALETLRELGRRFPRSFEYRRHRAHGIVLFTPWTTPEHIVGNARWMRRLDFAEVRSEAFRTRLRLYPRVPLHAMAERDGLLADAFDSSRPDRAVEQGYDASVPWRFADPRTEVVFEATHALMTRLRRLDEAGALEVAAEYAMRWPGLAAAPDAAWLALERTLDSWGDPRALCDRGAARLAAYDLELEGIAAGDRAACLKENVPAEHVEPLLRAYRAMGFSAGVAGRHGLVEGADTHVEGDSRAIVAVAKDDAALAEAIATFAAHRTDHGPGPIGRMARLLGYPACCADAFANVRERGDNLDNERQPFRRKAEATLDPRLHRVGRFRLVSHFPCTPDCGESVSRARRILERLRTRDEAGAEWLERELARPVLFVDYARRAFVDGQWEGDRLEVSTFEPIGEQWHGAPGTRITAIRLTRDGVELDSPGGGRRIEAPGAFVTWPGAALPAASRGAIQRAAPSPGTRAHATPGTTARADAEAFRTTVLGGLAIPHALAGEVRLAELRGAPGRVELVLARDDGEPIIAYVEPLRPDAPAFAKLKHLAFSYRNPPQDFAPQRLKQVLEQLRAILAAGDATLAETTLGSIFQPWT